MGHLLHLLADAAVIALVCVGVLVIRLKKWERRQQELNAPKPWVTLKVVLSPGITDADKRIAQGHAKVAPLLKEMGAQLAYVIQKEYAVDTSQTITPYFRVSADKQGLLQSAYSGYFPNGELNFFEVPRSSDPFRSIHRSHRAAHEYEGLDLARTAALDHMPGHNRTTLSARPA